MCGLAGWFDLGPDAGPPPSETRRQRALELLRPRGPDDEGAWIAPDGRAGLLHRRLAIVDAEGGAQPMTGPRGSRLAWNGELFEAAARREELRLQGAELRTRSDTEVLAHLLDGDGVRALDREPGQWAIAWIDAAETSLVLARDDAGEKPLFYAVSGRRVVFASTLDALRALAPVGEGLDAEAVSLYLSWGFVPAPLTIFRSVRKVEAGQRLRFERRSDDTTESTELTGATELDRRPAARRREPTGVDDLREALRSAARRRLHHADVPVGVFLSAGLDSLAVACALRDESSLRTFTVRARDAAFDESAEAAQVARALGVAHEVIEPPSADPGAWRRVLLRHGEPFGSASALAVDAVARAASAAGVRVALTGDGGDEALGGYPRHVLLRRLGAIPSLPRWMAPRGAGRGRRIRRLAQIVARSAAGRYAAMYEVLGEHRSAVFEGDGGEPAERRIAAAWGGAAAGDLGAMLRVDRAFELPDSHCVKVDVACMAHGVEPRSPFLDREVVEVSDALPSELRIAGRTTKVALRELLRRELPAGVARAALERPKRGFSAGIDDALGAPDAADLLLSGVLQRVPGMRAPAASGDGIHRLLDEHRAGHGNHRFRLAVLLGLAVFAEAHLR